ncbi:MAG: gephyrin-like molybdotransferase Glp [Acidimicrobiales bacterium]
MAMIPLEEAQHYVLESLRALDPVEARVADALGCVCAQDIVAIEALPGFPNSSMDGYALRASDTADGPVRLRVAATVLAGGKADRALEAGEAARIMTGAPLPDGTDAVSMIEEVEVDPDETSVLITRTINVGEFVRHPGEDIAIGQTLMSRGDRLGATQLGVLAGQGLTSLMVQPRPRVGVLSTGNELSGSGGTLGPAMIRDTNRPMLVALLRQSGFAPVDLGIVSDDAIEIKDTLHDAVETCDAVISTGGVSMGDVDFVKSVLAEICDGRARWMQVAIKPGKPFAFGVAGAANTPLFGLAGNPVSTRVGFELLVRPALRRLAGHRQLARPTINVVLDIPLTRERDGRLHLVHVVCRFHEDGRLHVVSAARQGSHLLNAVASGNALVTLPDGDGLNVGDPALAILLDDSPLGSASA